MVCIASLPQKTINLIDEDDSGLELVSETKNGGHKLLGVTEPLAHEIGYPEVDEDGARLLGYGFGQHGLAGAGRAVEEHPFLRGEELAEGEELGAAQGQDDELVERLLDLVEAADGVELDVDLVGVDDIARNHILVGGGLDERPAEALGDLLLLLERLLGGLAVGVELAEAREEDEAAERGAGRVEHQLLHEPRRVRRPHLPPARTPPPAVACGRRERGLGIRGGRLGFSLPLIHTKSEIQHMTSGVNTTTRRQATLALSIHKGELAE